MQIVHGCIIGAAGLCVLASTSARAEALAVKPGLWEVTSEGGGPARPMPQIPPDALAKLTPAQQAIVQQQMAAAAGGGAAQPVTRKICVTPAMLQSGFAGQGGGQRCTRSVVSVSAQSMQMKLSCTGDHPATGTLSVQVVDATTVTAVTDLTVTGKNGQSFPIHRTSQGKWLGADCGDVKPRE